MSQDVATVPNGRLSYCGDQVRRHDHERYLTCLLAPPDCREALFALYAFNHEVSKVRETVSEPMLGEIRLQWWRESLDGIFGGRPRDHAVVLALAAARSRRDFRRQRLDALIDARALDLEDRPPRSVGELRAYAEATSGGLLQTAVEVLGERTEAALEAARLVGVAWAYGGLLRAMPYQARRGRVFLPEDLQREVGLDPRDLLALRSSRAGREAVRRLAVAARGYLEQARALRRAVSAAGRSPLLLATLADAHLRRLARAGFDPFDERLTAPSPFSAWRLTFASARGRF